MGGRDKSALTLAGRTLLSHVAERLEPQVERLAISANGDPGRFSWSGLAVLQDESSLGPLSGVLAALDWGAALGADAVVTAPVDSPFLPGDLVPQLLLAAEASPNAAAVARSADRLFPVFAVWPVALRTELGRSLADGDAKVMRFADRIGAATADFPDPNAFLNINAPEDLVRAEAMLAVPR